MRLPAERLRRSPLIPRRAGRGPAGRPLARVLWSGRWLILALSVICSVLALLASFVITPVYRAEVVMARRSPPIETDCSSVNWAGFASLAGVNLSSGDDTAQALAVLHSRSFTEKFLDRHALLPIPMQTSGTARRRPGTWMTLRRPRHSEGSIRPVRQVRAHHHAGRHHGSRHADDRMVRPEGRNRLGQSARQRRQCGRTQPRDLQRRAASSSAPVACSRLPRSSWRTAYSV